MKLIRSELVENRSLVFFMEVWVDTEAEEMGQTTLMLL